MDGEIAWKPIYVIIKASSKQKNASVVTEEDIRLGLEHAHALFEDTKTLFEALTKKGG